MMKRTIRWIFVLTGPLSLLIAFAPALLKLHQWDSNARGYFGRWVVVVHPGTEVVIRQIGGSEWKFDYTPVKAVALIYFLVWVIGFLMPKREVPGEGNPRFHPGLRSTSDTGVRDD